MSRWLVGLGAVTVLLTASALRADEAPPPQAIVYGAREAKLVVETSDKATAPTVVVPVSLVTGPRRRGAGLLPGGLAGVALGLSLSAAVVSGGFWLLRRGRRTGAAAVLALALLGAAGVAWADRAPPPQPTTAVALPADLTFTNGTVTLDVARRGDEVRLVMPKKAVAAKAEPKPEK